MMSGGFITDHFKDIVDDCNAQLYLPGYMGTGTLGRILADGAQQVQIGEDTVNVK